MAKIESRDAITSGTPLSGAIYGEPSSHVELDSIGCPFLSDSHVKNHRRNPSVVCEHWF